MPRYEEDEIKDYFPDVGWIQIAQALNKSYYMDYWVDRNLEDKWFVRRTLNSLVSGFTIMTRCLPPPFYTARDSVGKISSGGAVDLFFTARRLSNGILEVWV